MTDAQRWTAFCCGWQGVGTFALIRTDHSGAIADLIWIVSEMATRIAVLEHEAANPRWCWL